MTKKIYLAVYGTLITNQPNHRFLEGATKVQDCEFKGFKMHDMGAFPALVEFFNEEKPTIYGELWEIDETILKRCDGLEGYPNFYNRKLIDVGEFVAWVYYCNRAETRPIIESGNWIEHIKGEKYVY